MADVKVSLDVKAVEEKMLKQHQKAMHAMTQQALKDCNYYCKQDQDGLINSSQINSDFENGKMVWQTPYARMQYYLDSASKDKNPNAQKMWAHKAASEHKEDWLKIYEKMLKGEG